YLVLSPFGVGLVLFREVRSGHFERRGLVLGTIYLTGIGQLARKRLPQAGQLRAVESQLAGDLGDRGVRIDKPAVAEACGALHCAVVVRGEPDRRMGSLDRPAGHCHVGQFADVVLEIDIVLGPQPLDDFEALLETAHALAARHAKGIELDIAVAETHAEYEITAPD